MTRPRLSPTPAGWSFAVLLATLFLMAANYSNNLIFALVVVLASTAALSVWQSWRNLAGIVLLVGEATPVFAGEAATLPLTLHAPAGGARHALRVRTHSEAGTHEASLASLAPATPTRLPLNLPCPRRGWQAVQGLTLASRFPLGLLEAHIELPIETRVLAWPAPTANAPAPACAASGEAADSFAGLRTWLPGESPRRIAWKAFARSGQLLARGFEGAEGEHAAALDWKATAGDTETRLGILARQVLDAEAAGQDYALALPGRRLPPARGEAQRHACLAALALFGHAETVA